MNNLSDDLAALGHYPEAERLIQQTVNVQRRTLGPEQPDTLVSELSLAAVFRKEHRFAEAEKLVRATLASQEKIYGPKNPNCAKSVYNLAAIASAQGQRDQAFSFLRDALDRGLEADLALHLDTDPELKTLHADPRFAALVTDAKQHAATPVASNN
jgi:non-specific serine/threonine protein kinase/serine/threonine-protein kinase